MTALTITRLIGVYDADGTLRGEVSYWVGARLGRAHCSLCEVTHGLFAPRRDWKKCRDGLPVAFETYHRDDQPDRVRSVLGDELPAVLAETDEGMVILVGPDGLESCAGSVDLLVEAIEQAVERESLAWP